MQSKKTTCLILFMLLFSIIYGIKLTINKRLQIATASANLTELIRDGCELINDSLAFSKLCVSLNDSLLEKSHLMAVFTAIDLSKETIDWSLYCDEVSVLSKVSDELFLYIDLYKGGNIKVWNKSVRLSDVRGLATNYILSPDNINKERFFIQLDNGLNKEVEVSKLGVFIRVHIKEGEGFSISDWKCFYSCLNELIEMFENEREKMSQKIWRKSYASLLFQEKMKLVDILGYHINIGFE